MRHRTLFKRLVGVLLLCGTPGFVFCSFGHWCIGGHLVHGPYSIWHKINDVGWSVAFVLAAVFSLWSDLRSRGRVLACLAITALLTPSCGLLSFLSLGAAILIAVREIMSRDPSAASPALPTERRTG